MGELRQIEEINDKGDLGTKKIPENPVDFGITVGIAKLNGLIQLSSPLTKMLAIFDMRTFMELG